MAEDYNIEQEEEQYSASNIQVLEGLEAVRKRPSMYIGDTHVKGLHHLVSEVVDNSIDEALAGFCDTIDVVITEDNSIRVSDNGRGIPVDEHEKLHKSALEVVMTVLHAGGKFDKGSYKVSGGLHGVGVSCVNALSDYLRAEVRRGGKVYMQEYSKGKPKGEVTVIGECSEEDHGTTVLFHPDAEIFQTTVYEYSILATRLRDLAYLNAGVKLTLTDLRNKDEEGNPHTETFYSKTGLDEFVRYIDASKEALIDDVIHISTNKGDIPVEVAMTYNTSFNENIYSYVNNTASRVPISDWYWTTNGNMQGFRARSVVGGHWMKVMMDKFQDLINKETGIAGPQTNTTADTPAARYNLNGQKLAQPEKGVNIIRYNDVSTKKVVVR